MAECTSETEDNDAEQEKEKTKDAHSVGLEQFLTCERSFKEKEDGMFRHKMLPELVLEFSQLVDTSNRRVIPHR